jgi:V/A-type H+-transporting ATPase subunit F
VKIFVIADPETYLAFALAGIKGEAVEFESEVATALQNLDRKEVGLVLITERLAQKNREVIDSILLEPDDLLIVEIPDTQGPVSEREKASERILSLVRR